MKVSQLTLNNFMIFDSLDLSLSPNINVISGDNSTGKTALLKILYSTLKSLNQIKSKDATKEQIEKIFVEKLQGVFRPDEKVIGRLVSRKRGSNRTDNTIVFDNGTQVQVGFGNRQEKHADIIIQPSEQSVHIEPVYFPPKEIISATENFQSLYEHYQIAFEETYYDLAKLLDRPLRKGANTSEQNKVLNSFEKIVDGSIIQRDKKFYLKEKGSGEFEMGLVSEGFRKISTIMYLILSGSLNKNSMLFWDEPENNMNPRMIRPIVEAVLELSKMGVQVFVATHNYFVQQCFNLVASYPKASKNKLDIRFISLYKDGDQIHLENKTSLSDLSNNLIMNEFDELYNREQDLIDDKE